MEKVLITIILSCKVIYMFFMGETWNQLLDKEISYKQVDYNKAINVEPNLEKMASIRESSIIDSILNEITLGQQKAKVNIKNVEVNEINLLPHITDDIYDSGKICVQNSKFQISDGLLKEIYELINCYGARTSFYAVNMEDNMTLGYNPDITFQTASTVKSPFVLYVYKKIDEGKVYLDDKISYDPRFYIEGAGLVSSNPVGTEYTLEELIFYTIHYSDNTSYNMLHNYLWDEGYNDMLRDLGCKEFYLNKGYIWGRGSTRSAALIWQEIYNFSKQCESGQTYLDILKDTEHSYIRNSLSDYKVASKYGWIQEHCHDTGFVFADKPYIIAIMTDNGGSWSGGEQVMKISICIDKVMKEYNQWQNDRIRYKDNIK